MHAVQCKIFIAFANFSCPAVDPRPNTPQHARSHNSQEPPADNTTVLLGTLKSPNFFASHCASVCEGRLAPWVHMAGQLWPSCKHQTVTAHRVQKSTSVFASAKSVASPGTTHMTACVTRSALVTVNIWHADRDEEHCGGCFHAGEQTWLSQQVALTQYNCWGRCKGPRGQSIHKTGA